MTAMLGGAFDRVASMVAALTTGRITKRRRRRAVRDCDRVDLRRVRPFTVLLVWTANSLYHVIVGRGGEVYVQGGAFFTGATRARVAGARDTRREVTAGWLAVGWRVDIRAGGRHVMTSRVRALATVRP